MQDFRQLKVWEKAHHFVLAVYRETSSFPVDERFGLTSQIRRASTSIPTNIAEGCGRSSNPDFARFLGMSMGSASEVEYQIVLARELGFFSHECAEALESDLMEIKRMLNALMQRVQNNSQGKSGLRTKD